MFQRLVVVLISLCTVTVKAQTLDEQYDFYLSLGCENLDFARGVADQLEPGQATEELAAYCSRPQANIPGATGTNSVGGNSALANGVSPNSSLNREERDRANGVSSNRWLSDRLAVFATMRYQQDQKEASAYEAGRETDAQDLMLGSDYRLSDSKVIGAALGFRAEEGEFTRGGELETRENTAWLFGSWTSAYGAADRIFVSGQVGVGRGDVNSSRYVGRETTVVVSEALAPEVMVGDQIDDSVEQEVTTVIDIPYALTSGERDSQRTAMMLRTGADFKVAGFTMGARLSMNYQRTSLGAYTESGTTPMVLAFNEQVRTSLFSELGMQTTYVYGSPMGVITSHFDIAWCHEWRNKQKAFSAQFAQDLRIDAARLTFLNQAPEQNWLNIRLASTVVLPRNLNGFVTLERVLSHRYIDRQSISFGVRKSF